TIEPTTGARLKGTGRCLNFIGIDRYTLTEDFKITHIDTDWDMLYGAAQLTGPGAPGAQPQPAEDRTTRSRLVGGPRSVWRPC
ncbi:hypothetical protein L829_4969, partial [Mycobacteroides abscessus MAB_030201_1075]